ncbi:MAG: thylakoid membrane photosystem I accumulation factor [Xenococcus sp. MO_188.B8]|nr:thylakoid membrane photosystem I accumulation factor [Xenococcus sp. MO_188.B8]
MIFAALKQKNIVRFTISKIKNILTRSTLLIIPLCLISLSWIWSPAALAGIDDDRYDGNVYVVYAGNGSLVPPPLDFAESRSREMPIILVYYVDDSSDCKKFSIVVSRMQKFYGRAASIIPVTVDSIPLKANYSPEELGYYYQGFVPQTVILDQKGKVVFDEQGQIPYEEIDDTLREVFDLLPRSESVELKRRSFNEFNYELVD